jgi:hypothetical protein
MKIVRIAGVLVEIQANNFQNAITLQVHQPASGIRLQISFLTIRVNIKILLNILRFYFSIST